MGIYYTNWGNTVFPIPKFLKDSIEIYHERTRSSVRLRRAIDNRATKHDAFESVSFVFAL